MAETKRQRFGAEAALRKTVNAVKAQVEAMGGDLFEIGLLNADAAQGPPMLLRTWDVPTLLKSVPWLRFQNSAGRHIYIRPHGEHSLTLLDDLVPAKVSTMRKEGFEPAVVVRTSPGNLQAWLKHPEMLQKDVATKVAKMLAEQWGGDPSSADWRHFGRLVGFTNLKQKYRFDEGLFPFVRLESASGRTFSRSRVVLEEAKRILEEEQQLRDARVSSPGSRDLSSVRSIQDFRNDARYGGDGNRIDLAYALHALSHGLSESEVASALQTRDLSHKGNESRQAHYVDRTLQKAIDRLRPNNARDR